MGCQIMHTYNITVFLKGTFSEMKYPIKSIHVLLKNYSSFENFTHACYDFFENLTFPRNFSNLYSVEENTFIISSLQRNYNSFFSIEENTHRTML